jgi:hypothetical protein
MVQVQTLLSTGTQEAGCCPRGGKGTCSCGSEKRQQGDAVRAAVNSAATLALKGQIISVELAVVIASHLFARFLCECDMSI